MDDIFGWISHSGLSGANSLLLALLVILIRGRLKDMDRKVNTLWDWHNIQTGVQKGNKHKPSRKEQDDD